MSESSMPSSVIECLTCGQAANLTGFMLNAGGYRAYGHTDTAHLPLWAAESDDWEIVPCGELRVGDVLATGETIHAVTLPTDDDLDNPDCDARVSLILDGRTGNAGYPDESAIRRVL